MASFKKFLEEYKRSKLGVVGVVIVVFFAILAISAPLLTNENPIYSQNLASPLSVPAWAKVFPQYRNLPLNSQLLKDPSFSQQAQSAWFIASDDAGGGSVSYQITNKGLVVNITPPQNPYAPQPVLVLNQSFYYPWSYTCDFKLYLNVTPLSSNFSSDELIVNAFLKSVDGTVYHVLGPSVYTDPTSSTEYYPKFLKSHSYVIFASSKDPFVNLLATGTIFPTNLGSCGLAQAVFRHPGNASVSITIAATKKASILVSNVNLRIQGSAFGVLGTDDLGRSVWSQFVYGARVSLAVGLVAALIAVVIGTLVGLVAGYVGGLVDELLMRFTDFMLTIPFLPFVLILLTIIQVAQIRIVNQEFVILILIAIFSWQGIARIIRSQVLSIKERPFVEASKALGASSAHIIWRHILPNVMGLVYANMALTVPSAILTEAALTFLGFGDPNIISWGTMLSNAQASLTAQHAFVWWWFLPPGIAIAVLSMAFIFIGFSLDAILNPKLRKR